DFRYMYGFYYVIQGTTELYVEYLGLISLDSIKMFIYMGRASSVWLEELHMLDVSFEYGTMLVQPRRNATLVLRSCSTRIIYSPYFLTYISSEPVSAEISYCTFSNLSRKGFFKLGGAHGSIVVTDCLFNSSSYDVFYESSVIDIGGSNMDVTVSNCNISDIPSMCNY
ncbi:MAG: hypothetical protein NXI00_24420, partial [Cytophagales bacterium]|nr:hypothetical protein [Cytophagales bacterium]